MSKTNQHSTVVPHEVMPADNGMENLGHESIAAANDSRFVQTHFNQPLTDFAIGYRDENTEALLEFLAPAVPVSRRFSWRKTDPSEFFLSETDDVRSIGAAHKIVQYSSDEVESRTYNKGLAIRIDKDELDEDDASWQQRYVAWLIRRLRVNEIRRAVSVLDANDASATTPTWDPSPAANAAKANPLKDIRAAVNSGGNAHGMDPNRIAFGALGANYLFDMLEANEGALGYVRSLQEVAERCGATQAMKVDTRYMTKKGTGNKTQTLGADIYVFHAESGAMKDDPSNIKRFISTAGGGQYRVFLDDSDAKFFVLTVEHYSRIVCTNTSGIRKITPAQA